MTLSRSSYDGTCRTGIYHSPVSIDPSQNLPLCNLLCSVEFLYTGKQWTMAMKGEGGSFSLANQDGSVDLKYNGMSYRLQQLDLYHVNVHPIKDKKGTPIPYDGEAHLIHLSVDKTRCLNVAVFLRAGVIFSYSQSFFEEFLVASLPQTPLAIQLSKEWTPYTVLPPQKSFFIYRGDMLYSPCVPSSSITEIDWIVMENPAEIHTSEFAVLVKIALAATGFPPQTQGSRSIYYNSGEYVAGSSVPGSVIVKCSRNASNFSLTTDQVQGTTVLQASLDTPCVASQDLQGGTGVLFLYFLMTMMLIVFLGQGIAVTTQDGVPASSSAPDKFMILVFSMIIFVYVLFTLSTASRIGTLVSVIITSLLLAGYRYLFSSFFGKDVTSWIERILWILASFIPFFLICSVAMGCFQLLLRSSRFSVLAWSLLPSNYRSTFQSLFSVDTSYFQVKNNSSYLISLQPFVTISFLGQNFPFMSKTCTMINLPTYFVGVTSAFFFYLGTEYENNRKQGTAPYASFTASLYSVLKNHPSTTNLTTADVTTLTTHYLDTDFDTKYTTLHQKFQLPEIYQKLIPGVSES